MNRGEAGRNGRASGGGARKEETKGSGRNVGDCKEGERSGGSGAGGCCGTSTFLSPITPNHQTTKILVEGARRVWGTMKVTTTNSLKSVISKFCEVTAVKFKRKTVCDSAGQIKRWWFVMHGSEDALQILDSKWGQIRAQTCWKLEQCFRPVSEENTSTSQTLDLPSSNVSPAEESATPTTGSDACNSVEQLSSASESQSTPIQAAPFLES